jgi:hypothetical protein
MSTVLGSNPGPCVKKMPSSRLPAFFASCLTVSLVSSRHAMKSMWGSGCTTRRICNIGSRWRWTVSYTFRLLCPRYPRRSGCGGCNKYFAVLEFVPWPSNPHQLHWTKMLASIYSRVCVCGRGGGLRACVRADCEILCLAVIFLSLMTSRRLQAVVSKSCSQRLILFFLPSTLRFIITCYLHTSSVS